MNIRQKPIEFPLLQNFLVANLTGITLSFVKSTLRNLNLNPLSAENCLIKNQNDWQAIATHLNTHDYPDNEKLACSMLFLHIEMHFRNFEYLDIAIDMIKIQRKLPLEFGLIDEMWKYIYVKMIQNFDPPEIYDKTKNSELFIKSTDLLILIGTMYYWYLENKNPIKNCNEIIEIIEQKIKKFSQFVCSELKIKVSQGPGDNHLTHFKSFFGRVKNRLELGEN